MPVAQYPYTASITFTKKPTKFLIEFNATDGQDYLLVYNFVNGTYIRNSSNISASYNELTNTITVTFLKGGMAVIGTDIDAKITLLYDE